MSPEQVFQKTDKGREEIARRTFRLDARRRTLLILVDGQSDVANLTEKIAHMGDAESMLTTLLADGFIEAPGGGAPAEPVAVTSSQRPVEAAPASAPAGSSLPLEDLKRAACTAIERLMGPDGDSLALKLEKAATRDAFYVEARKAHEALKAFLGPKRAEAFAKAVGL